jgi:hypothetical protein
MPRLPLGAPVGALFSFASFCSSSFALAGCAPAPPPSVPVSVSAPAPAPPSDLGARAWTRLTQALPGAWTLPAKNGVFTVSYKLISGDSALVEEWGRGTPNETETVFYPDHDDLLLTHFCAQGNQPRLRVVEITGDAIVFRFVDVTNRLPGKSMLVERTLHFGGDSFDDTEVYRGPDGTNETTAYHFTRAAR